MLTKVEVAFRGFLPSFLEIIKAWQPGELSGELKYRDSLLRFIRDAVPSDCRVEKEYRHDGTTTDIFIAWTGLLFKDKIFIEIKRNMNKKAILDRLVGQIESLHPGRNVIVIVFVGETDQGLLARLRAKYTAFEDSAVSLDPPVAIVVK
jgi:hypothetical protein